jgi:hypothetical protein
MRFRRLLAVPVLIGWILPPAVGAEPQAAAKAKPENLGQLLRWKESYEDEAVKLRARCTAHWGSTLMASPPSK